MKHAMLDSNGAFSNVVYHLLKFLTELHFRLQSQRKSIP